MKTTVQRITLNADNDYQAVLYPATPDTALDADGVPAQVNTNVEKAGLHVQVQRITGDNEIAGADLYLQLWSVPLVEEDAYGVDAVSVDTLDNEDKVLIASRRIFADLGFDWDTDGIGMYCPVIAVSKDALTFDIDALTGDVNVNVELSATR